MSPIEVLLSSVLWVSRQDNDTEKVFSWLQDVLCIIRYVMYMNILWWTLYCWILMNLLGYVQHAIFTENNGFTLIFEGNRTHILTWQKLLILDVWILINFAESSSNLSKYTNFLPFTAVCHSRLLNHRDISKALTFILEALLSR